MGENFQPRRQPHARRGDEQRPSGGDPRRAVSEKAGAAGTGAEREERTGRLPAVSRFLLVKRNRLRSAGGFYGGGSMEKQDKELELLKQLPAQKRIELLEEKVMDLENLVEQFREVIQYLQGKY